MGKSIVGLDISDHTIEVVELGGSATSPKILGMARAHLGDGIVEYGMIKDEKKLADTLKKLFAAAKPKKIDHNNIVFGLPESLTYIHTFRADSHSAKNREQLVRQELVATVPLDETSFVYSYSVLKDTKDGVDILAVAIDRETFVVWKNFFKKYKFEVEIFDIESLALFRNLEIDLKKDTCVVDVGDKTTRVSIFDKTGLKFNYTVHLAGDHITQSLVDKQKIKKDKAETEKIKSGLVGKNKKISDTITKSVDEILLQVQEGINFYMEQSQQEVSQVVFVGGTAKLKGLVEYAKHVLKTDVTLGHSRVRGKSIPLEYIEATGLALRGLSKKWDKHHPTIDPKIRLPKVAKQNRKKDITQIPSELGAVDTAKKNKPTLLIILLIISVAALAWAFLYRSAQDNKPKDDVYLAELEELDVILETKGVEVIDIEEDVVTSTEIMTTSTISTSTNDVVSSTLVTSTSIN